MGQLLFIPYSSAGSAPTPSGVFDIYLSGRNGSDANDGLTPATAKATPAGVWELFPAGLSGPLVVHCGAAGVVGDDVAYNWASMPVPAQLNETARIWIYGDGAGQPGEDGFEEIATGAAAPGTDAQQITVAGPLAVNVYQHFTLEMLAGPAAGYRRTVQQNTSTSISPCRWFDNQAGAIGSVTPVSGNAFRIIRPSVIFTGTDTQTGQPGFLGNLGGGDGFAPVFLVNISLNLTTQTEINECTIYGYGLEIRGLGTLYMNECSGSIGWWDNLQTFYVTPLPRGTRVDAAKAEWFADIGVSTSIQQLAVWRGWGISSPDSIVATSTSIVRVNSSYLSLIGTWGQFQANASIVLVGGYFWGAFGTNETNAYLIGRANYSSSDTNSCVFRRQLSVTGGTFQTWISFTYDSSLTGMNLTGCSGAIIGGVAGTSITSTANTHGLLLSGGSDCFMDGSVAINSPIIGPYRGTLSIEEGSHLRDVRNVTVTNTSAGGGRILVVKDGSTFQASESSGTNTFTCSGASNGSVEIDENSAFISAGATQLTTLTNATMRVYGSYCQLNHSLSITGVFGTCLSIYNSTFVQGIAPIGALNSVNVFSKSAVGPVNAPALDILNSDVYMFGTSLTVTHTGSGDGVRVQNSDVYLSMATTINGGPLSIGGSDVVFLSTVTLPAHRMELLQSSVDFRGAVAVFDRVRLRQSAAQCLANFTVTPSTGTNLLISDGSTFIQAGGTLSCTGVGSTFSVLVEFLSSARFIGGASTVINGNNVGLTAASGSKAWFNGAPTFVTGTAGADLAVGGNAPVANGTLAAANNFITDTDTTGLLGGGNVIGRAA